MKLDEFMVGLHEVAEDLLEQEQPHSIKAIELKRIIETIRLSIDEYTQILEQTSIVAAKMGTVANRLNQLSSNEVKRN